MRTFHHIGLVAQNEMSGETYYDSLKVWGTDPQRDPNKVEWVRFAPDSPLADTPLARMPHISFAVDDMDRALEGKELVIGPLSIGVGTRIAYFMLDGALIEYLQTK